MDNKLKPCPFCGSKEVRVICYDKYVATYRVECSKCWAHSATKVCREDTIELWNRRANFGDQ